MTDISKQTVLTLAQLSSLELSDDEITSLQVDISNILSYVDQLKELDTSGVEPTYQPNQLQNTWRSDEVDQPLERQALLDLAPLDESNQIKVPKVL